MATQRYISTSFWDDPWVQTLSSDGHLVYLYLLTNPLTNIAGIYEITDRRILFDTHVDEETLSKLWEDFAEKGKAHRIDNWVIIPSWPKHQRITARDKIRQGIDSVLLSLPEKVWCELLNLNYQYVFLDEVERKAPSMPHKSPLDTPSMPLTRDGNYSDTDINKNKNKNKNINTENSFSSPDQDGRYHYKDSELDEFIQYANETEAFPKERKLVINMPNAGEIHDIFSYYSPEEIKQAFDNYSEIVRNLEVYDVTPFKSLQNFLKKDGLAKFVDSSEPHKRYARGQPSMDIMDDIQTDFNQEVF